MECILSLSNRYHGRLYSDRNIQAPLSLLRFSSDSTIVLFKHSKESLVASLIVYNRPRIYQSESIPLIEKRSQIIRFTTDSVVQKQKSDGRTAGTAIQAGAQLPEPQESSEGEDRIKSLAQ